MKLPEQLIGNYSGGVIRCGRKPLPESIAAFFIDRKHPVFGDAAG